MPNSVSFFKSCLGKSYSSGTMDVAAPHNKEDFLVPDFCAVPSSMVFPVP